MERAVGDMVDGGLEWKWRRNLWLRVCSRGLLYKAKEPVPKDWGFMKNGALTATKEMRNCLFAPAGGEKCDGTIVSIS